MPLDVGVDGGELLQRLHSSKSEHRPLSSPERQMAVLRPVVGPAADLLFGGVAELGHGRFVRA